MPQTDPNSEMVYPLHKAGSARISRNFAPASVTSIKFLSPETAAQTERILITGAAGFLGQELATALYKDSQLFKMTLTDLIPPPIPEQIKTNHPLAHRNIRTVASDLNDPASSDRVFLNRYTTIYLLHGLMSSGAESNQALGWAVNFDSMRLTLDTLARTSPGARVIFASTLAVYSADRPITPDTPAITETNCAPLPRTSYGAQKLMVETYLCDLSRRGLLDGRVARLPSVFVRPGAPAAASNSFVSAIMREPVAGRRAVMPVSEELSMWVCSPEAAVGSLVRLRDVEAGEMGGCRVVNTPGRSVTGREILGALERWAGKEARDLVVGERDAEVERVVGSWPVWFHSSKATRLGMEEDMTVDEIVRRYVEKYGEVKPATQ